MGIVSQKGADNYLRTMPEMIDAHAREVCQRRGDPEIVAANEFVRSMEALADEWDEETGPLYHGWAIHKGFLAGVAWQRKKES